jgi:hypothetical protein
MRIFKVAKIAYDHLVDVHTPSGSFKAYPIPKQGTPKGMIAVKKQLTGEIVFVYPQDCTADKDWENRMDEIATSREIGQMDADEKDAKYRMPEWAHLNVNEW